MAKYQYNDYPISMPGLPAAWDQTTHHYAVMLQGKEEADSFKFYLACSDKPYTALTVNGAWVISFPIDASVRYFSYVLTEEFVWKDRGLADLDSLFAEGVQGYYFRDDKVYWRWCNEDICNESGNVVYAGSEPVLVEEEPEKPNPGKLRSWLTGFALGLAGKPLPISSVTRTTRPCEYVSVYK